MPRSGVIHCRHTAGRLAGARRWLVVAFALLCGAMTADAGAVGSLQAAEVLKELLGLGEGLSGRLLLYDALGPTFRTITVKRDPDCPLCGDAPSITDLSAHRG